MVLDGCHSLQYTELKSINTFPLRKLHGIVTQETTINNCKTTDTFKNWNLRRSSSTYVSAILLLYQNSSTQTQDFILWDSLSVSVWVVWVHKVTHAPQPFYNLLCIPICFIPPVVPLLWQSAVSYIMESHHSRLVP
jgi:hypothetical protein